MSSISRRIVLLSSAALAGAAFLGPAQAQDLNITIGYQTVVEPSKVAQADGAYEKATKATIDWRKFDSGADVIAAVASGSVDIGYVGSSPLAAAASRELPIQTIFVVGLIGQSEALVARNGSGIEKIADLAGKKVAVPFVSTTHYSLLAALKHENVDPKSVEILNLRPPEIAAAFARGDIDAAYVWDPALGQIKTTGKVELDSSQVAAWGAPTFDAWIVRTDFAEKNPDAVRDFVKVTGESYAQFLAKPEAWSVSSPEAAKIAKITGAKLEEVPQLLKGYVFPTLEEQASDKFLGGGTVKAIEAASAFLKEQGKIDAVLPDYSKYVSSKYVTEALASN
ncbi:MULTISPECIES: taurine ABC transporter substrate-binding protein [unclassified Mesorhizobium]|uniref:taurine ABC transporter substrate-binding protein n=1 Tax=unclassified Mesorhizobium TaxID=325217 RepID=UPI0003CED26D|nr:MULTISPECIES: taurine ABC transporter substrate-binding protein [unclassified Mesorhizobium]ESW90817.1 taurine ABC transporter substrate-binding protein [Mesorhizobium sp. LSJC269B00]ESZ05203.1 taurine ABC transporter substrate-binding protein [Mesorhizobium sp. L2C089B000]WJI49400.1 taurine ABC transporter substrate-binding protein [Mesorhizobium sp. C089B]